MPELQQQPGPQNASLIESELRFRSVSDCAPVGIWVCDKSGDCVWLNRHWLQFAGARLEDHVGRGWANIIHPDDRDASVQAYLTAFNRQESFQLAYRLRRSDGEYRWHTATGNPRFGDRDEFLGYVGISIEDHAARVANEEQARLQAEIQEAAAIHAALINQSENFLGLMKLDGTLIDANRTALKAAGVSQADVLGKPFWETPWWTHSPELQQRLKDAVEKVKRGQKVCFDATHPTPDGGEVEVEFTLKPVRDETDEVIYLIPEGRDVTQLRAQLRETKDLALALERSNQQLDQFASVASHDLQAPLRRITMLGKSLQEEYGDKFDEDGRYFLDTMIDCTQRLKALIRDLLELGRINNQARQLTPVAAQECYEQAIGYLEVAIDETNAVVTADLLPTVMAHSSLLTRLLQNLIGNAIKYRGDQTPKVHVSCRHEGEYVQFAVRDNGIGIDEQYFDRIFQIFQRLHSVSEYEGTGVGLAACQRIVTSFGGKIWVESTPGQGSTFYFTLKATEK